MKISVAAIGDVTKVSTFSGTPFHFWATARKMGLPFEAWQMDLSKVRNQRRLWNLMKVLSFQRTGGYQYSESFSKKILQQIPVAFLEGKVITFNQHFPPADQVMRYGGKVYPYIDATFSQLIDRYGVRRLIGRRMIAETLARERFFFENAESIYTMQQWAKESIVNDYRIAEKKVKVVLPGANILFDDNYVPSMSPDGVGTERPLVLGFVGKEWKRKGLNTIIDIRDELEKRGWKAVVRCAGFAPPELKRRRGVEFVGFIDKHSNYQQFISFLESCDIGCLFSSAEFSSISVLEFISVGRPVAGFVVDGMGDLFMKDLSLRFSVNQDVKTMTEHFERYLTDQAFRMKMKLEAINQCEYVRWGRSIKQINQFLV